MLATTCSIRTSDLAARVALETFVSKPKIDVDLSHCKRSVATLCANVCVLNTHKKSAQQKNPESFDK